MEDPDRPGDHACPHTLVTSIPDGIHKHKHTHNVNRWIEVKAESRAECDEISRVRIRMLPSPREPCRVLRVARTWVFADGDLMGRQRFAPPSKRRRQAEVEAGCPLTPHHDCLREQQAAGVTHHAGSFGVVAGLGKRGDTLHVESAFQFGTDTAFNNRIIPSRRHFPCSSHRVRPHPHVGSGTGAVRRVPPVSSPRPSNRACGSPAHGSPTSFTAGIRCHPPGPSGPGCFHGSVKTDQPELVRGGMIQHVPAEATANGSTRPSRARTG